MTTARINVSELAKEWLKDPVFKAEYDALEEEFSLAAALIRARDDAHSYAVGDIRESAKSNEEDRI